VATLLRQLDDCLEVQPFTSEIVVVDDNSPDGTADAVSATEMLVKTRVVVRKGEKGLASAVMRGFDEARGRVCVVMDADGSHPVQAVPKIIEPVLSGGAEMAIASRYVPGGGIENWRPRRRILSLGATLVTKPLTHGKDVRDPMSGFFAIDKRILGRAKVNPIGYKIGFEILVRCNPRPVVEVPYQFQDRKGGESKLGPRQVADYVVHMGQLYCYTYLGRASGQSA
jgi:dolichol-phosphate mannosyltransferase